MTSYTSTKLGEMNSAKREKGYSRALAMDERPVVLFGANFANYRQGCEVLLGKGEASGWDLFLMGCRRTIYVAAASHDTSPSSRGDFENGERKQIEDRAHNPSNTVLFQDALNPLTIQGTDNSLEVLPVTLSQMAESDIESVSAERCVEEAKRAQYMYVIEKQSRLYRALWGRFSEDRFCPHLNGYYICNVVQSSLPIIFYATLCFPPQPRNHNGGNLTSSQDIETFQQIVEAQWKFDTQSRGTGYTLA